MLHSLYIRDFAIAAQVELDCESGLTVVTGETGAGKSIVVDALGLALGGRADTGAIRHGAPCTEIVASFAPTPEVEEWLEIQELSAEGECITRRVIYPDKPAKAFINGRPTTAQAQRALGALLVDIHGQHEHQSLLKRDVQRTLVDRCGDLGAAVAQVADTYRSVQDLSQRLDKLVGQTTGDQSELELLRYQVGELEELNPDPDEYAALEEEHKRLAHAGELQTGVQALLYALYDSDEHAVKTLLDRSIIRLAALAEYDVELHDPRQALERAGVEIDEAIAGLRPATGRAESDPERQAEVEQRIGLLLDTARKHRCTPDELPQVVERLRARQHELENLDEVIAETRDARERQYQAYLAQAIDVSERRARAAKALSNAVTAQLQDLGFNGGALHVAVTRLPEDQAGPHGLDRVEFQVRTNPDQPLRALTKVASGGELSRISLAIQIVSKAAVSVSTLIFDEVDVGIGGRVAEIVGQMLSELGETRQVLCITHLPQVAAQGHHHVCVNKTHAENTMISVATLDDRQRVEELARMLGGVEITRQTLAHAEDLLGRLAS